MRRQETWLAARPMAWKDEQARLVGSGRPYLPIVYSYCLFAYLPIARFIDMLLV